MIPEPDPRRTVSLERIMEPGELASLINERELQLLAVDYDADDAR